MQRFDELDKASMKADIPAFRAGDTVKVHVKVVEGTRSRIQVFQGVVIRRHGAGVTETFTVRKVSFGVGVERTFPVHSPTISKIEVVTRGDVRRAKLYYLRDRVGQRDRVREKRYVGPEEVVVPGLLHEEQSEAEAAEAAEVAALDAAAAEAAGAEAVAAHGLGAAAARRMGDDHRSLPCGARVGGPGAAARPG